MNPTRHNRSGNTSAQPASVVRTVVFAGAVFHKAIIQTQKHPCRQSCGCRFTNAGIDANCRATRYHVHTNAISATMTSTDPRVSGVKPNTLRALRNSANGSVMAITTAPSASSRRRRLGVSHGNTGPHTRCHHAMIAGCR
jgi:hypothetical protein